MKQPRLLIMAGGTGGHVFPGLAVAEKLRATGWEIYWLGTAAKMEARLVPQHGYDIRFIDVAGVRGNGVMRKLAAPFKVISAIIQSLKVLNEIQPDLVIGMGGYASGPGGIAAWLKRIPLLLHEQNAAPGMTNRILSHFASRVLTAFPGVFNGLKKADTKLLQVGNPVRSAVVATEDKKLKPHGPLHILVVGGSLGAQILNQTLPAVASQLTNGVRIWHQVGKGNQAAIKQLYDAEKVSDVVVDEFIDDMAAAYQWADLIVCRAGALTVSEAAAAGVPAIFVPLPHAVDDHQTKNAQWLVDAGAALMYKQQDLTIAGLVTGIETLDKDRTRLYEMGKQARAQAIIDADVRVAQLCREIINNGIEK